MVKFSENDHEGEKNVIINERKHFSQNCLCFSYYTWNGDGYKERGILKKFNWAFMKKY